MKDRKDRYGVIGDPIAHSRSPEIHRAFSEEAKRNGGQPINYEAIHCPISPDLEGIFSKKVQSLRKEGYKGLNVTVPYKLAAYQFAKNHGTLSERAQQAQAVNTLIFKDGEITGDNTDGIGLVRDIQNNFSQETGTHYHIKGKRILLMGAGGAAQGALGPLLDCEPAYVFCVNRTPEKAKNLIKIFLKQTELQSSLKEVAKSSLEGSEFSPRPDVFISSSAKGPGLPPPKGFMPSPPTPLPRTGEGRQENSSPWLTTSLPSSENKLQKKFHCKNRKSFFIDKSFTWKFIKSFIFFPSAIKESLVQLKKLGPKLWVRNWVQISNEKQRKRPSPVLGRGVGGEGFETLEAGSFNEIDPNNPKFQFDLVINATAGSLNGELPPLKPGIFAKNALAYDMMYGAAARLFLDEAKRLGATHIRDGLGMLVEQAAESFYLWRGIQPTTRTVLDDLRKSIENSRATYGNSLK